MEGGWRWLVASHPPPNLPLEGGRDELGKGGGARKKVGRDELGEGDGMGRRNGAICNVFERALA